MKSKNQHPFLVTALTVAGFVFTASSIFAVSLTWDTALGDGATITAVSGNWNTTAGNTVWNNGTSNVIWSQTASNDGSNTATFAGTDGSPNQYVITLAAQMAAESITFNNSGYQIPGRVMAPWLGAISSKVGSFSGTLSVNSPVSDILVGKLSASGVIFPADQGSSYVGAGLVKIPVTGKKGAFRTGIVILNR